MLSSGERGAPSSVLGVNKTESALLWDTRALPSLIWSALMDLFSPSFACLSRIPIAGSSATASSRSLRLKLVGCPTRPRPSPPSLIRSISPASAFWPLDDDPRRTVQDIFSVPPARSSTRGPVTPRTPPPPARNRN